MITNQVSKLIPQGVINHVRDRFEPLNEEHLVIAINDMSPFELFDAWCSYEGILNYSETIWEIVVRLHALEEERGCPRHFQIPPAWISIPETPPEVPQTSEVYILTWASTVDMLDSDNALDQGVINSSLSVALFQAEKLLGDLVGSNRLYESADQGSIDLVWLEDVDGDQWDTESSLYALRIRKLPVFVPDRKELPDFRHRIQTSS